MEKAVSGQRSACQNCAALARENAELRQVIIRQRWIIERLQRRIQQVVAYAANVRSQASRVMSQHQPRGTWSLWRGKGEVAQEVCNRLRGE